MNWLVRSGQFSFRYRGLLLPIAVALLLLPSPRLAPSAASVGAIGFAIALLGQLVRVGAIGMVYVIRGGRDRRVYAEDLVTEGAYAHCRNPMYAGNFLLLAGLALASNSWLFVAVATPLVGFMYRAIVAAEEDFLRGKFGARYDDYCGRVSRWLPRLDGLATTFRSARFNWRRVLKAEYFGPFDWLAGAALIVLVNLARDGVLGGHRPLVAAMAIVVAGRLMLWAVARRVVATV